MGNITEKIFKLPETAAAMPSSAKKNVTQTEEDLPGLLLKATSAAAMPSSAKKKRHANQGRFAWFT